MNKKLILLIPALLLSVCDVFAQGEIWCMTDKGIFKMDGTNPTEAILVAPFNNTNGLYPGDNLALAGNGKLYGVTVGGGTFDYGVIFEFDPATSTYTKKYDFDGDANGVTPNTLTLASNGKLYGLTQGGGAYMSGIIFEYDLSTDVFTKKLDFGPFVAGSIGAVPGSGLALAPNGKLYGTATRGGANDMGVLFEYDPATNTYTKKIDFDGTNGSYPSSDLTLATNNKFYGTINNGGDNNLGVIFEYDPATNNYVVKYHFEAGADGAVPMSTVALGSSGKIYGATWHTFSADYDGTLFEYDYVNGTYTRKHSFGIGNDGLVPYGLTLAGNSNLYGITTRGGVNDMGTLYEFNPAANTFAVKIHFNTTNGRNPSPPMYFHTQSITFGALSAKTVGDPAFSLTAAGGASGNPVIFTSSNPAVATVSGNTVTIIGAGTTTITASQAGSTSYMSAANVSRTLSVAKQSQTITFNTLAGKSFGDASFALAATASSGLAVTYASSNTSVATVSGNTVTIVGAGTTTITASQAGNANYLPATDAPQTLFVSVMAQEITFGPLANKTFGDAPFELTGTASSGLPVYYFSSDEDVATVSGNIVTIVGAGVTGITAWQDGNANVDGANGVTQTLTVDKATQTITFGALGNRTFGDSPVTLTATASSGLAVNYSSSNANVATLLNNILTIVAPGATTITVTQAGNANYYEAGEVTQTLIVNKAGQTITFNSIGDKTIGDASFNLTATAPSGLPVTFATTSDKVSIAGNRVTLVKPGRVSITASQAETAEYMEAAPVTRSFCIKAAKPTITLSGLDTEAPTLTSSASEGNQWFLNDMAIGGATANTLTVTAPGVYKVQVQVDDCLSEFSNNQTLIVTGLENNTGDRLITVYPNPSSEWIAVSLGGVAGKKQVTIFQMDGEQKASAEVEASEWKFRVSDFAAGTYVLQVKAGATMKVIRFVKK